MPKNDDELLKPCGICIDVEGEWYHGDNRIVRPEILELLYEKLELAPDGGYLLVDRNEKCLLDVADAPYVISRVDGEKGGSADECIVLGLKHLSRREVLDPRTLYAGKDNVLYCRILNGRFPARFSRPAYYQIAEFFEQSVEGEFYIAINGIKYCLQICG